MPEAAPKPYYLLIIVLAQFAGTSLWFAGNAVIGDLNNELANPVNIATITSAVQFGFITGTLIFSFLHLADKYKSTEVFLYSSLIAALANVLTVIVPMTGFSLLFLRFATGFFIAGIYPVGMKIAADVFPGKMGHALGYLVGALVLGTAFPHLLRSQFQSYSYSLIIIFTSVLAAVGGILIYYFIPAKKAIASFTFRNSTLYKMFKSTPFRSAAFGYFGHMWELYTLWAFIPIAIVHFNVINNSSLPVSLLSFFIIGIGSIGCVAGGYLSQRTGSKKVAVFALLISGLCCLLSPFLFEASSFIFIFFFLVWGFFVVADSPQFSALVAATAPQENKGTALSLVVSIGFAITIVSLNMIERVPAEYFKYSFLLLAPGPLFGLIALIKKRSLKTTIDSSKVKDSIPV
jgi:MFS family permease